MKFWQHLEGQFNILRQSQIMLWSYSHHLSIRVGFIHTNSPPWIIVLLQPKITTKHTWLRWASYTPTDQSTIKHDKHIYILVAPIPLTHGKRPSNRIPIKNDRMISQTPIIFSFWSLQTLSKSINSVTKHQPKYCQPQIKPWLLIGWPPTYFYYD